MDVRREELLPGARFAKQQHGGIGCRDLFNLRQHTPEGRTLPDDAAPILPALAHHGPRQTRIDIRHISTPGLSRTGLAVEASIIHVDSQHTSGWRISKE